jgi:hypothetical protein
MPEISDNSNNLSERDSTFILTALEALRQDLSDLLMDTTKRERALRSIALVDSAAEKLNNQELSFTSEECGIMYIAASEMRDLMNRILDDQRSSEYDREMARSTLYTSNAMMRALRKIFEENDMNIEDYIKLS